jgi:hypothetical protein
MSTNALRAQYSRDILSMVVDDCLTKKLYTPAQQDAATIKDAILQQMELEDVKDRDLFLQVLDGFLATMHVSQRLQAAYENKDENRPHMRVMQRRSQADG